MKFSEYKFLVLSDLYRITGNTKIITLLGYVILGGPFKFNFWFRTCQYSKSHAFLNYTIYPIVRIMLRHLTYKLGISIPHATSIGSGFHISHFGGIVVNERDA